MKQHFLFLALLLFFLQINAQQISKIEKQNHDANNQSASANNILGCTPATPPPTPALPLMSLFTKPTMATNMSSTGVSIAVKPNGTVWGSGSDQDGEMGDGIVGNPFTTNNVWVQVPSPNITNIKQVSLGFNTAIVLRGDGTVWGWGDNWWGKIGNGSSWQSAQPTPQQTLIAPGNPLTNVVKVSCGYAMTFALTANHHVYGWGNNYGGTMGPSYTANTWYSYAGEITDNGTTPINWATDISVGDEFVAILRWDSTLWTMGNGQFGQLGNGNTYGPGGGSAIPSRVVASSACNPLTKIISIAVGRRFMLALDVTGAVWGWGLNNYGQTGTGAGPDVFIPKRVLGNNCSGFLTNITSIAASGNNGYAIDASGNLWSWGEDFDGQLGDGSPPDGNFDCPKIATTGVLEVQAGLSSVLILKNDECVYGAGNNWYGSLGGPLPASCCGVVSSFQLTNLSNICNTPLPLDLVSFRGENKNNINHLYWTSASEINFDYFIVERSSDGNSFEKIALIKANENSSQLQNYFFADKFPLTGINYYRLKQVDFNGVFTFSKTISIENKSDGFNCNISTESNHTYSLHCNQPGNASISILNVQGNLLEEFILNTNDNVIIDLSKYPFGIYILKIHSPEKNQTYKLVKNY